VTQSANVVWHGGGVDREMRRLYLGLSGATVWFTGLPSSGKSTLARALEESLVAQGMAAYVLDGDNLRHGLNGDLGFDAGSRQENVRRTAEVARLFADAGVIALVSLVSPYGADRARARAMHEADGVRFIEVFVNRSVEECERRDPKGLYARARRGEIPAFTGVDAPYEAPERPELELTHEGVEEAVDRVLEMLASGSPASVRDA
jgi:adenylyl-sulfate kinase